MITRRKMLALSAAVGGASVLGLAAQEFLLPGQVASWQGIALGGQASMRIVHSDPAVAKNTLNLAITELRRLEKIFSLYDPESSISKLNKAGQLISPPIELVMVLKAARHISQASGGVFDVTVQPLWNFYSTKKTGHIKNVLPVMGQERINISQDKITMAKGQKITLNGIAQGAITDQLMAFFRREGFTDLLLGTGEISAIGQSEEKQPWRVALGNKDGPVIDIHNAALATSEPFPLGSDSDKSHFFNPRTGKSEHHFNRVSVIAPNATLADGLSTALMLSEETSWSELLSHFKTIPLTLHFERLDGSIGKVTSL